MSVRHPAYFGKQEPSTQMAWAFSVASCILLEVVLVQCVGYKDAVYPFCLEPACAIESAHGMHLHGG
jgi:hypothetical protein